MSMSLDAKRLQAKQNVLRLRMIAKGLKVDQVFGRRVMIKVVKPYTEMDRAKASGLALPADAEERNTPLPSTGIVIAVGDGLKHENEWNTAADVVNFRSPVEVGDMIMFSKYAGTDFRVDEDDYRILDINEVICRLVAVDESAETYVEENSPSGF